METCQCPLEVKRFEPTDNAFEIEGYASTFGNPDLVNDVIEQGAFAESIAKRRPLFLLNHNAHDLPLGRIEEIHENKKGLKFKASMPKTDKFVAERVAPQIQHGSFEGVSIGFKIDQSADSEKGRRTIKKATLYEISLVNIPCNPKAGVTSFKSLSIEEFEDLSLGEREAALKSSGAFSDRLCERLAKAWRDAEHKGGMPNQKSERDAGEQDALAAALKDLTAKINDATRSIHDA